MWGPRGTPGALTAAPEHSSSRSVRRLKHARQIIATGEAYESRVSAIKGIESVRKNASDTALDDQPGQDPFFTRWANPVTATMDSLHLHWPALLEAGLRRPGWSCPPYWQATGGPQSRLGR
jgi:uncharacterized protein YegP (UPF0339 family)